MGAAVKVADVAFCSHTCREAAKVICATAQIPFEHYQNLMKAYSLLEMALLQIKEQVPVEREVA